MKTNKLWLSATLLLLITSANAQNDFSATPDTPETVRINALSEELASAVETVSNQKKTIAILEDELADFKSALNLAQNQHEEITLAGLTMPASQYSSALTFLSGFLFLIAAVFVIRFRNANYITRKSTEALANLEEEHEEHIRISLEREQKLRRQLQDEINRHKISQAS